MRTVAAVVVLVLCVHAGLWSLLQRHQAVADIDYPLASISYSPYTRSQHPDLGDRPTEAQIRADLKVLSPYTQAIRTYGSTGGGELIPAIAEEFGLKVTLGIWIDKNETRNEREIQSAIALARRYRNVNAIVVGNETIYRAEKTIPELIKIIQRVKRQSSVPVTTGEIWSVWVEHPELASAVDFIAAHILPYWEGVPTDKVVGQTIEFYDKLRRVHPGKRIVIAEVGWASAGYNMLRAYPGRIDQATILRDFVSRADAYGIDYNVIEAFDQPWKTNEGSVGMYWGVFDAARQPKFSWVGLAHDPEHWRTAGLALLLGLLLSLPMLARSRVTAGEAFTLAIAANAAAAWLALVFAFWETHYFVPGSAFALALGIALLAPLVAIALKRIEEIAAVAFGYRPRRLIAGPLAAADGFAPKVSIHVPAYREPPEMLKATLDALARLDYPSFECLIVINNTPDPAFWRPIEEHCRALGDRFKFVRDDNVAGFKAGALRLALDRTPAHAEILRHRNGPPQRDECRHRARHHVPYSPRGAPLRRRMVERHHRRGFRPWPRRARAGLADSLHQSALRPRASPRYVRRLQEAASSLGLWRPADSQKALAIVAAARGQPHAPAEARVRVGLPQLARCRSSRRAGRHPQHRLGAGRCFRRHCHSRPDPHGADPCGLCRYPCALCGPLPPAGRRTPCADDGRRPCRDGGAVDGSSGRRPRPMERKPSLHAHRQGGRDAQRPGLPGLLGSRARHAAHRRGSDHRRHELQADRRAQYFRAGACCAEPAVPRGGGARCV